MGLFSRDEQPTWSELSSLGDEIAKLRKENKALREVAEAGRKLRLEIMDGSTTLKNFGNLEAALEKLDEARRG